MSAQPIVDLSGLPPIDTAYGADPSLYADELRHYITAAANGSPRSRQTALGPSEIGTPCALKLGYKLAGTPRANTGLTAQDVLRPSIGTAMHGWLAEAFAAANAGRAGVRWLVEARVHVGQIDGTDVDGNCDLLDRVTATATDWKITTLAKIRAYRANGPGQQYRVQAHAYGLGWVNRGVHVERVAVMFLPRDGLLSQSFLWSERWDKSVALQAIQRADGIARSLRLLGAPTVLRALDRAPDYCTYCPWFVRGSTNRAVACDGLTR